MRIKHAVGILFAVAALGSAVRAEEFVVDTDGFTQGTMDYRGYTITVDALVDVDFSSPLMEVQLEGGGLTEKQIMSAASQCFEIAPRKQQAMYYATFRFGNGEDNATPSLAPLRSIYPITDEALQARLMKCYEFLDLLHIGHPQAPEYAMYISRKRPGYQILSPQEAQTAENVFTCINIPIVIEGMPINATHSGGTSGYGKTPTETASIEYPYVSLAFDSEGRLVSGNVSNYSVSNIKPLEGTPIPWTDAVIAALDTAFDRYLEKPHSPEAFFAEFEIRVSSVKAVWLPNWIATLRPGYVIRFDVYDKATGEWVSPRSDRYRISLAGCIEAVTGTPSEDYLRYAE